ncbi:transporter substrate-binding domain-containing protein [Vacuolonema iberomarrocanum]|uniref:transporter substrate-binding domain-containing protein n=1 Tax=Vacuolonema iberomarrocanum TaxID=3454632 RepID=UPI0019F0F679|nr:transporter substrate-binding domain-containing protein [filamentous cyanobacterium LEGE 07170]
MHPLLQKCSAIALLSLGCWSLPLIPLKLLTPAHAADLDTVRQRGHFVVAVKDNLRPLGFWDDAGNLVGLEIDIARRLAAEILGDETAVVFEPVANRDRLPMLTEGEVDLVVARLTLTEARSRLVSFSQPYYLDGTTFVTRNPAIQSPQNLRGRQVAVLEGSDTIAVVRSRLPSAQLVGVTSYTEALEALEQGTIDAFAADASVLTGWVQEYPSYRMLPALWAGEALAIALPRGLEHQELREAVNAALQRWQEEGWLDERIRYWGLPAPINFADSP